MQRLPIVNPETISIESILSRPGKKYSVSYFQRDYSWTKDQWDNYITDVTESLNEKRQHFFGFMTFLKSDSPDVFQIIEGQQRLATVTVLAAVIRDLFKVRNFEKWREIDDRLIKPKDMFSDKTYSKLKLSDTNSVFFEEYIQKEGDPLAKLDQMKKQKAMRYKSNRLIRDCYEYFYNKISGKPEQDLLEILQQTTREFLVMSAEVVDLSSAYILFQTLNDRGLDLTLSDLLKTHILRVAKDDWEEVKKEWDSILSLSGMDNMNMFLRHYWLSTRGVVKEEKLFDEFSKEIKTREDAFKIVKELKKEAENYSALWDPEPADFGGKKKTVDSLKNGLYVLSKKQVLPLLLAAYGRLNEDSFLKLVSQTTNFIFRYLTIGEQENKELEHLFSDVAIDIRKGKAKDAVEIAKDLKKKDIDDDTFRQLFKTKQMKDNRKAAYILTMIETFLRKQPGEFSPDMTLEHIMPVNPDEDCKKYLEQKKMWDDKDEWAYRIGNLTLLLEKPNKRARNKLPMIKAKEIYSKESTLKINEKLKNINDWTNKEIESRQEELAEYALQIWKM